MPRGSVGALLSVIVVAACGVDESENTAGSRLRCEHPAAADPASPAPVIFESATVEPGPHQPIPARIVDGKHFVGVVMTTTRTFTVTGLGAHLFTSAPPCADCPNDVSMAVVPLDSTTNLPRTNTLSDAICWTVGAIPNVEPVDQPEPFASTVFPADFVLPAGAWGLVLASNRFDTKYVEALLPLDVTPVGTPSYIHYFEAEDVGAGPETGQWAHTAAPGEHIRLFAIGY